MREIELKGKVYGNTHQVIDALAWATNRRGRNTWKSDSNVINVIIDYLDKHNVDLPGANNMHGGTAGVIRNVIKRLVSEGWAEVSQAKPGAPMTMFKFKEDVDLNGHIPRFRRVASTLATHPPTTYDDGGSEGRTPSGTPATLRAGTKMLSDPGSLPPLNLEAILPAGPRPPRYLEENVNSLLDIWAEKDPEAYAKWAETLMERLGAIYG